MNNPFVAHNTYANLIRSRMGLPVLTKYVESQMSEVESTGARSRDLDQIMAHLDEIGVRLQLLLDHPAARRVLGGIPDVNRQSAPDVDLVLHGTAGAEDGGHDVGYSIHNDFTPAA